MNASGFKPALPGISSSKRLGFFSFSGGNQPLDLKPRGVCLIKAAMEETRTLKLDVNGKVEDKLPNGHAGKNHNRLSTMGNSTNIKWHECPVEKIDRQKLLKQKGCVVWITGLSGSGKSTVACALSHMLYQRGSLSYILDGDNIRHGLNRDLSFKAEDRAENIRRVGEVAKLFADAGFICIACLISPYRRDRAECRAMLPSDDFVEVGASPAYDLFFKLQVQQVFMDVPLQVCENRDPKGLYKLARAGKIKGFTGVDDPYEPPLDAEIVLQCNTGDCSTPCDMAEKVISYLEVKGYLQA
ncbi:adenylyl-sulfate kinase 3 isoform X1 [Populus trichocarpa]|uniref:adenylyl-sulfate kinase 3 isoform X1 n=1 Tax=Populus trichocarpa TaxID=3694 RepID=UPI002278F627|nr:adenylyl-sulfate kinase 3 isoform X1 [Populus trichocarpa]